MSDKPLRAQKKRSLPLDDIPALSLPVPASGRLPAKSNISPALSMHGVESCVQTGVISFSVQLGEGAYPSPQDMELLLVGVKLQHLKVTLLTTSGPTACSTEEQLKLCTSQVAILLTAIARSTDSITHLSLTINNTPQPGSYDVQPPQLDIINPFTIEVLVPVPDDVASMANSVVAKLAPALPKLRILHLCGCVSQKSLQAFAPTFPNLTSVQVEALSVPIRTVKFLLPRLPKLTHFVMTSELVDQSSEGQELLNTYIFGTFNALHTRSKLTKVHMALASETWLNIPGDSYDVLPRCLQELQFSYKVDFSDPTLLESLQKVRRLAIVDFPFANLSEFSSQFPKIERLTVNSPTEIVMECCYDSGANDIRQLQSILNGKLVLVVPSLKLEGKSSMVRDLLAVLPPLSATTSVTLSVQGKRPYTFCMDHVARVFPNLKRLTIMGEGAMCGASDPMTDQAFVAPLLKCKLLERLQLSVQLTFTTESLEKMCLGFPCLSFLCYHPCAGVDGEKLKAGVQKQRLDFEFMPTVEHGYHAYPEGVNSTYE